MTSGGFLARLFGRKNAKPETGIVARPEDEEHRAIGFGYKTGWIAIRTEKIGDVVRALGPGNVSVVPWRQGLAAVDGRTGPIRQVFVTPRSDGFVCVVLGLQGALDHKAHVETMKDLVARLSAQFGWAAYFGSYRVVDYVAWVFAEEGRITRVFAWVGGNHPVIEGTPSAGEMELGLPFEPDQSPEDFTEALNAQPADDMEMPSEDMPLILAAGMSVDPREFDGKGLGQGALAEIA